MAISQPTAERGAMSDLALKATPPRAPRNLLVRPRLAAEDPQFRDRPLIVVQAPAGFGKTSLLAQWRRELLGRGAVVAWLSAQAGDNPARFVQSLVLAVQIGCGRPTFGQTLLGGGSAGGELEDITVWLAELGQTALDVVLVVDDAERLPPATVRALAYLLHNQPPNLRVVIAARGELDLDVAELETYGQCVTVGAALLRFTLPETIELVRARCGTRIDADDCARLHEATEGWPLGLQLALTAIERSADARAAIAAMSTRSGDLPGHLLGGLLAHLAPDDAAFLTRVAVLDHLHPDLCSLLSGADAAARLARLARDTPVLVAVEGSEWLRLHALARDFLRTRFAALPAEERGAIQARAAQWLADHGLLEEAARQAFEAGRRELAYDLAEKCLYEAMIGGRQTAVLDWLARLPEAEVDRRPRLRLAVAWALALSERHDDAERQVARILDQPGVDDALRYECALISSGAALYADDPDQFIELFARWADSSPPTTDPALRRMHANRLAWRAILLGEPAEARRHEQQAPRGDFGPAFGFMARWGDLIVGLSYLWEGQVRLVEETLRPVVADVEAVLGRRAPLTCMLATVLATALWERNRPDQAAALLANRLDVVERAGLPDTLLLAYRTLARIAAAEGGEHRALDLLELLHAAGVSGRLPRLCIASLADQVRVHARRFRPETCRALCERIDEIFARDDLPRGELWRRSAEVLRAVARANAAIAAQDWPRAIEASGHAGALAEALRLGRMRIEMMALRAFALDRNADDGLPLLREAINLAETYGLARLFVDAHPALGDWARRAAAGASGMVDTRPAPPWQRPAGPERAAGTPRAVASTVLTPKEREVLELLARNLSNKEIALAMEVGEETIKWHLKNLFGKLSAGNRKQVVRRAQLLGLLEQAR